MHPEGTKDQNRQGIGDPMHGYLALMRRTDVFRTCILINLLAMFIMPSTWIGNILVMLGCRTIFYSKRYKLPFRHPQVDGDSKKTGEGIIYLGNEQSTGSEIWISNDDARRHSLVLGTTGSGKALPTDTLVLTENGWTRMADLTPGDTIRHPSGSLVTVTGVYPQGKLSAVRLGLADGRSVVCSRDHLWHVRCTCIAGNGTVCRDTVMKATDIAFYLEASCIPGAPNAASQGPYIPLTEPVPGVENGHPLDQELARRVGRAGFRMSDFTVPITGDAGSRLDWTLDMLAARHLSAPITGRGGRLVLQALNMTDASIMRQLIWSLGGYAMLVASGSDLLVHAAMPGLERLELPGLTCDVSLLELGLEIVSVEGAGLPDRQAGDIQPGEDVRDVDGIEMVCIRVDADDGLFLIDNFIVTHNTELLLGMVSQSLIWSSGFLFIDGKGTGEFHARVWSLARRFGRQDDYRILNFTGDSSIGDQPSTGSNMQSNTINPFSHGTPDQLMNLIVSLMSDDGSKSNMWQQRAMALVTSAMKALCEMRDSGDVLLNVQTIRDFLPLGIGVKKGLLKGRTIGEVSEIPAEAWEELRTRGGMIELYLRAMNGEFSLKSLAALKGFFNSLPGFSLTNALNGEEQQSKAAEQHGFLSMQLTKPLGSLADDFGHIFCTPIGEVDMEDIVLNRRILVVLLPALQKAPEEMQNCGRIVVALLKMMMGNVAGSELVGNKQGLVDARSTNSVSPFIVIMDEAGYYMVKGIDVMMAQARSLGFMMVIAGQDMAAMQYISPQIAETAAANSRLTIAGATEDAHRTWQFLKRKFSTARVPVVTGQRMESGLMGQRLVDRPDVSFVEKDRIRIDELQKLSVGEFYYLMESRLVRANSFYTREYWSERISVNKFLIIRGPFDRAPGLDQSEETGFVEALEAVSERLLDREELERKIGEYPFDPFDCFMESVETVDAIQNSHRTSMEPIPWGISAILLAHNRRSS